MKNRNFPQINHSFSKAMSDDQRFLLPCDDPLTRGIAAFCTPISSARSRFASSLELSHGIVKTIWLIGDMADPWCLFNINIDIKS
jgi:hypothetical protein